MRRSQTVRHYARSSLTSPIVDELGSVREGDEPVDEVLSLRRQLLEKDREHDRLRDQILSLEAQLSVRPPIERIQDITKEYQNLEIILEGTQRENERCMAELERGKAREKMLEQALAKVAGENWQAVLDVAPTPSTFISRPGMSTILPRAPFTSPDPQHPQNFTSPTPSTHASTSTPASADATMAHMEQIRLLILGMDQRLQAREEKLVKAVEKAEGEGLRFEGMRNEVLAKV